MCDITFGGRPVGSHLNHTRRLLTAWHAGMVDQRTLAAAFASAGWWLYPTSFEETSCITAMKAQALGTRRKGAALVYASIILGMRCGPR
jgi:hypothetical protein